jgi:hypothetical protein
MNILKHSLQSAKVLLDDISPYLLSGDGDQQNPFVFKGISEENPILLKNYV